MLFRDIKQNPRSGCIDNEVWQVNAVFLSLTVLKSNLKN